MNPDVLYELVVGGEGLDAVLALVRLGVVAVALPRVHLHRRLVHEDLEGERNEICVKSDLWKENETMVDCDE